MAAKKPASRARRRVHGGPALPAPDLALQRKVVDAFLAASPAGDLEALLAVVAPGGRLLYVLQLTVGQDRVTEIDVIGDPVRLRSLDLAVAPEPGR